MSRTVASRAGRRRPRPVDGCVQAVHRLLHLQRHHHRHRVAQHAPQAPRDQGGERTRLQTGIRCSRASTKRDADESGSDRSRRHRGLTPFVQECSTPLAARSHTQRGSYPRMRCCGPTEGSVPPTFGRGNRGTLARATSPLSAVAKPWVYRGCSRRSRHPAQRANAPARRRGRCEEVENLRVLRPLAYAAASSSSGFLVT